MPGAPNPLREMGNAEGRAICHDERPNPGFKTSALPGFKLTVLGRRAIREFDSQPIPESVMRDCLQDAILAPSASNLQSYEIYWVKDDVKKSRVADLCLGQPAAKTAGDLLVIVSRVDLWKTHLNKLVDIMTERAGTPIKGPVADYYTNIVLMLMTTDRWGFHNLKRRLMFWYKRRTEPMVDEPISRADHRIYGHVQASLAAQTLLLSLAAHGFESCPMSGVDKRGIGTALNLPAMAEVTMVIAAGTGKSSGRLSERIRLPFIDLVKEI